MWRSGADANLPIPRVAVHLASSSVAHGAVLERTWSLLGASFEASWAPEGTRLASTSADGKVVVSDASSATTQPNTTLCADTCYASHGYCEDCGPGSESSDCVLGTDCTDCGERVVESGVLAVLATCSCLQCANWFVFSSVEPSVAVADFWSDFGRFCSKLHRKSSFADDKTSGTAS